MPLTRSSTRASRTSAVSSVRTFRPWAVVATSSSRRRFSGTFAASRETCASALPPAGTVSVAGETVKAPVLLRFSGTGAPETLR